MNILRTKVDLLDEVEKLRSQLRATASNALMPSILVDGGGGTMRELLLHAEELLGESVPYINSESKSVITG